MVRAAGAGRRSARRRCAASRSRRDLEVESGQLDAAINRLDVILDTAPRKEGWLVRRGEVLASMGRFAEAERDVLAAEREIARLPVTRRNVPAMQTLLERIQRVKARGGE